MNQSDQRAERQALWNGFGNGLSQAFELVAAPAIFGVIGWLVDRSVGVFPVFTIVFGALATIGGFARAYYNYEAQMAAEEKDKPWTRNRR
jgi:F0F1-type ATP synthase assembly protein I